MKKVIQGSEKFTKRMAISVGSAGISMKDLEDGVQIPVTAAALVEDKDNETGEDKVIACFVDPNGAIYSSISNNIVDVVPDVIELLNEEGQVDIRLLKRKSKSDRLFLSIIVL